MNPSGKGWLNKYLEFRAGSFDNNFRGNFFNDLLKIPTDQFFYKNFQPTGLMYGYPLQVPDPMVAEMKQWSQKDKMKVIAAEGFIRSGIIYAEGDPEKILSSESEISYLLEGLSEFYRGVYHDIFRGPRWMSVKLFKNKLALTEKMLTERMKPKSTSMWAGFFENSLLFLDVYYFGHWHAGTEKIISEENIRKENDKIRFAILQIIAAAANADQSIEKEEKKIFNFFVQSAGLPPKLEKDAYLLLKAGHTIEKLDLPDIDHWIIRKYMLELAILTTYSDKVMDEQEHQFLIRLAEKLGIPREELEQSILAIESFVVSNWSEVHFLQRKHSLHMVSNRFRKNVGQVISVNKDRIATEIRESKELVYLLNKSRKTALTPEEKEKVRIQLIDILKTIPTFVIIALPFSFLTLPVLLSLLPKNAFPSAFQD